MTDRIHPPTPHYEHGAHPAAGDLTIHDRGYPWCAHAVAHPDHNGDHFDANRHVSAHECRSLEAFLDGVRENLGGNDLGLSVYTAAPFRYGMPRDNLLPTAPRIVIETWPSDEDETSRRISIAPGEALRLARVLEYAVDLLLVPRATSGPLVSPTSRPDR